MAFSGYDPLDPYGVNGDPNGPPDQPPGPQPLNTPQFPWSDNEINDVRQFSKAWRGEHGITSGSEGDLEIAYENLRMQGLSHDDARQGAVNVLGWQGNSQQPAAPQPAGPSAQAAPGPVTSSGPDFSQTGGGGDLTAPFTQTFQAPTPQALPNAPTFNAPAYTPPPAFNYDEFHSPGAFQAPTAEQAQNEPGFAFSRDQANGAFMANRAASQTAHTGGTIKDFLDYNKNLNSQQYQSVYNRAADTYDRNFNNALTTYGANRANAVGTYNTNYQTQYQDPWSIADTRAQQEFAPRLIQYQTDAANAQHGNDVANNNALNEWYQNYAIFRGNQDSAFDKRFRVATA